MPPIAEEHRRRNESTRDRWQTMASHRAHVMSLLRAVRGDGDRSLCILGAGNANDIDLAELLRDFRRITLVDLDDAALQRAVEQLATTDRERIESHGGVDLTGILPALSRWTSGVSTSVEEVSETLVAARSAPKPEIDPCDVVASTCVLTQLIDSVCLSLNANHRNFTELLLAVRNRHLEFMVELLSPGGIGILITDFVSSETAPELTRLDESQIPAASQQWIAHRNFFTGANPFAIRDYLAGLAAPLTCENLQISPAWRWDIGAKQLAVSAVTFTRRQ